jgi:hypothetical protein
MASSFLCWDLPEDLIVQIIFPAVLAKCQMVCAGECFSVAESVKMLESLLVLRSVNKVWKELVDGSVEYQALRLANACVSKLTAEDYAWMGYDPQEFLVKQFTQIVRFFSTSGYISTRVDDPRLMSEPLQNLSLCELWKLRDMLSVSFHEIWIGRVPNVSGLPYWIAPAERNQ